MNRDLGSGGAAQMFHNWLTNRMRDSLFFPVSSSPESTVIDVPVFPRRQMHHRRIRTSFSCLSMSMFAKKRRVRSRLWFVLCFRIFGLMCGLPSRGRSRSRKEVGSDQQATRSQPLPLCYTCPSVPLNAEGGGEGGREAGRAENRKQR